MRQALRHATLAASLLATAGVLSGCSSEEGAGGKMEGATSTGKMGGDMEKPKMVDGMAPTGKTDGAMDKGAMDKGTMADPPK
jgi:hypothetical protein